MVPHCIKYSHYIFFPALLLQTFMMIVLDRGTGCAQCVPVSAVLTSAVFGGKQTQLTWPESVQCAGNGRGN